MALHKMAAQHVAASIPLLTLLNTGQQQVIQLVDPSLDSSGLRGRMDKSAGLHRWTTEVSFPQHRNVRSHGRNPILPSDENFAGWHLS
jgi:hypothetical protein